MEVPNIQRIATSVPAIAQAVVDTATAVQSGATVKLATAAALPAGTYSNTAGTFTVTATGTLTVDGVVTALNDTILVKDQVSTFQNGHYTVTTAGAVGVSAVLTRTPGWTSAAAFQAGTTIGTGPAGTANPSKVFQQTSATCATLGTDAITYGLAVTTAPDAATGTKGITKLSVAPASASNPIAVGTNDTRMAPAPSGAAKILYDTGAAYAATAAGTAAQIPVINAGATAPVFVSMSGDATLASTGAITVTKVNGSLFQSGVATLTNGDSGAIAATVTANTRIVIGGKSPNTTALTVTYAALTGDRVVGAPGSFNIKALLADGTINVADQSTVDWIAFG